MKITADTNVLVRALVRDDPQQAQTATDALLSASLVAVALPSLCELVWVLRRVYGFGAGDAAAARHGKTDRGGGGAGAAGGLRQGRGGAG